MQNDYLTTFDHPLIQHKVSHMCDVRTGSKEFNELENEIAMLMGYETLKDLKTVDKEIQAPLSKIKTPFIDEDFTIVPILRAGLGMVDGLRQLLPTCRIGHIGLYRDENDLKPRTYYYKLPENCQNDQIIIVDPALATGVSINRAIEILKEQGCKKIKVMCIFGAKQGIDLIHNNHPEVKIYAARYTTDPLNEKGYIITAAGDTGDRTNGTYSLKTMF